MSILWIVGAFILVLTPIVLVHECGHFIAARLCGIQIEEFGFGLPPRAITLFERKGTLYSLNWIPVGGFVRPSGENDPSIPGGLAAVSKPARLLVLAAGGMANFLMAFLILWVGFLIGPKATVVTAVHEGSAAMHGGIQAEDILIEMNGLKVDSPRLMADIIDQFRGRPLPVTVQRGESFISLSVVPSPDNLLPLGIDIDQPAHGRHVHRSPGEAARETIHYLWQIISTTLNAPGQLARGEMDVEAARPVSVVGMSQIAGRATAASFITGSAFPLLLMVGVISAALGFTQLLPLPALDGGRILFVLIEMISGHRIRPQRETAVHRAGMFALLFLMLALIVLDIINPVL